MATSRKERLEILHRHGADIARIQHCLLVSAHTVTPLQAVSMWLDYSESHCAMWLHYILLNLTEISIEFASKLVCNYVVCNILSNLPEYVWPAQDSINQKSKTPETP